MMNAFRKMVAMTVVVALASFATLDVAVAQSSTVEPQELLRSWYKLILELVRHTPTYSPPVASRSFAYVGVTAFEAIASGSKELQSLANQLNGLQTVPPRAAGETYNDGIVVNAAMASAVLGFFSNTGPTGQRAMVALEAKSGAEAARGVPADVVARSEAYGRALAAHILAWSQDDGGAVIENMGFPLDYKLTPGLAHWVPTSLIQQQQVPLLPNWGRNRTFSMPDGATCALPPPPEYGEGRSSEFYKQALEVYETKQSLTPEQMAIARFWSDEPTLSPTRDHQRYRP